MTSWEGVVNDVTIPGDPGAIESAAFVWTLVFQGLLEVRQRVDSGLINMDGYLKGSAAEAYMGSLGQLAKELKAFDEDNRRICEVLFGAAADLREAMLNIPIPQSMVPDIVRKRQEFEQNDEYWPLPRDAFLRQAMAANNPDDVYDDHGSPLDLIPNAVRAKWNDMGGGNHEARAVGIYNDLNHKYTVAQDMMPTGSTDVTSTAGGYTPLPEDDPFRKGGGGGFKIPTRTLDADSTLDDDFTDPFDRTGDLSSGLASADGGQLTGASNLHSGGTGPLPGLGRSNLVGAGGLGPGGATSLAGAGMTPAALAAAMKGIGTPVQAGMGGMPPPMMGTGGAGAKAGSNRKPGLIGSGGPGPGKGPADAHGTWLLEEDDVWGTDSGAAPPLLS